LYSVHRKTLIRLGQGLFCIGGVVELTHFPQFAVDK